MEKIIVSKKISTSSIKIDTSTVNRLNLKTACHSTEGVIDIYRFSPSPDHPQRLDSWSSSVQDTALELSALSTEPRLAVDPQLRSERNTSAAHSPRLCVSGT